MNATPDQNIEQQIHDILVRTRQQARHGRKAEDGLNFDDAKSAILKQVSEARIDELRLFVQELVCRDDVLNEKAILNTILEHESDRYNELKQTPPTPNTGTGSAPTVNVTKTTIDKVLRKLPVSGLVENEPLASKDVAKKPKMCLIYRGNKAPYCDKCFNCTAPTSVNREEK